MIHNNVSMDEKEVIFIFINKNLQAFFYVMMVNITMIKYITEKRTGLMVSKIRACLLKVQSLLSKVVSETI